MGLFCGTILTIRSKVEMIQKNYNMTNRVNHRADAKRFTQTMQKIDIMSILGRCKK